MKNKTKKEIIKFLNENYLNETFTINGLYSSLFANLEFSSFDDLATKTNEFFSFLRENVNLIQSFDLPESRILKLINDAQQNVYHFLLNKQNIENQKLFTSNVQNLSKSLSVNNILDVGPGYSAISSILFAKHFKHVTAMDSSFYLSSLALKNMNVLPLKQYFNKQTDISDYDLVVGSMPCGAIEPIVKKCSENQKPYIILLCDCELPVQDRPKDPDIGWKPILEKIDPKIKFYKGYAFNIDLAPEEIIKSIKTLEFKGTKSIDKVIPKYETKSQKSNNKPKQPPKSLVNIDDYLDYDIRFE